MKYSRTELRANTNDNEMFIRFQNGSTWQCIGSDTIQHTVGASRCRNCILRICVGKSGGVGVLPANASKKTKAGRRSSLLPEDAIIAYSMFQYASQSPEWFCELLTAKDTGALSDEALAETLKEYMALYGDDMGQRAVRSGILLQLQCAILGAYFALEMAKVRQEEPHHGIEAEHDRHVTPGLGLGRQGRHVDLVVADARRADYSSSTTTQRQASASSITPRSSRSKSKQHGWRDGVDWVPHDAKVKEWGSGKTRVETMEQLGLNPMLVPMATFQDGINAVRRTLPLCVFHPRSEETGIRCAGAVQTGMG